MYTRWMVSSQSYKYLAIIIFSCPFAKNNNKMRENTNHDTTLAGNVAHGLKVTNEISNKLLRWNSLLLEHARVGYFRNLVNFIVKLLVYSFGTSASLIPAWMYISYISRHNIWCRKHEWCASPKLFELLRFFMIASNIKAFPSKVF